MRIFCGSFRHPARRSASSKGKLGISTPSSSISCWMASSDTSIVALSCSVSTVSNSLRGVDSSYTEPGRGVATRALVAWSPAYTLSHSMMSPLSTSSKDLGAMLGSYC